MREMTHITKVLYDENCGLMMGCFRGYIRIFDANNFQSTGKWKNQINPKPTTNQQDRLHVKANVINFR